MVHDTIFNEKAIVVGQTQYRVYLISATTIHWDNTSNRQKQTVVRYHGDVRKRAYPVGLNYKVLWECAKMMQYVERHSESAYDIH